MDTAAPQQIAFILDNVIDYQTLVEGIPAGTPVYVLDSSGDVLAQMAAITSGYSNLDVIHLLSHGNDGALDLGTLNLDSANINDYAGVLSKIGASLSESGDILLYGCNVAQDQNGIDFIGRLAQFSGADIAASNDVTGSTAQRGDWVLEAANGAVDAQSLSIEGYQGLLAAFSGTGGTVDFDTAGAGATVTNTGGDSLAACTVGTFSLQVSSGTLVNGADSNIVDIADSLGDGSKLASFEMVGTATIQFAAGEVFDATSLYLCSYSWTGGTSSRDYTITGYNGASVVGTTTQTVASYDTVAGGSERTSGSTVTLNWTNLTKIVITPTGVGYDYGTTGDTGLSSTFFVDDLVLANVHAPVASPTVTSAVYDASTNSLVVTGTNMTATAGVTNDINVAKLTLTGEGGATYTLTSSNVEIDSATQFTVALNATDQINVEGLLNKNGTSSVGATTYNIAAAADWDVASTGNADLTGNGITVSNTQTPTLSTATYDASTGALVVTGTNLVTVNGANNDITANKISIRAEGNVTYVLTDTPNVDITSATSFTLNLSATDKAALNQIINKNGTDPTSGSPYLIKGADDWNTVVTGGDISDIANNWVTASNVAVPTITSSTYNVSTGALVVTGTGFTHLSNGGTDDIVANKFTFTGEGGATYTLTDSADVEITSGTAFTITLSATDKAALNIMMNKDGAASTSGTTYNLAAAEDWAAGADAAVVVADLTGNGVTVSNVAAPTITSATYNASTGALVVTGTGFLSKSGATDDIVANKFTFTAEGGSTYTLTDTSNVEITSGTAFTITLSATDLAALNQIVNKNGTSSTSGTTYNLAAAEDWAAGADAAVVVADTAGNGITVSNVAAPAITSATYDYNTNVLTVTGTGFLQKSGATNDIDLTKLTFTGEGGATYTLTNATGVEITSGTSFTTTLSGADLINVETLLNKNGTSADSGTTYNLAAAEDWAVGADAAAVVADLSGNGITLSNYAAPTVTSAAYDAGTHVLSVTGTNLVSKSGATNDVAVSLLTLAGEGGSYTLTSSDVEITNATAFSVTLNAADQLVVNGLLNKNGTASSGATTYNLAAAEDWMAGTASATVVADTTGNGITVSNVQTPTITSAVYDSTSGVLAVTGTNFFSKVGANNDIDLTKLTFTGQGGAGAAYTLTSASNVEITSATSFSVTLSGTDKTNVDALLNQIGTTASDTTTYNLAAANNWLAGADSAAVITDAVNAITVSINPAITSATYDAATGSLVVTGTNMQAQAGVTNDITANKLTFTGEGGATYTLTDSANVELTSATSFTIALSVTDKAAINQIVNKDGTSSTGATAYNLAAADDWNAQVSAGDTSDLTGNGITASNVAIPTITSSTYNASTGALVVTGTGFLKLSGATNDIVANKFTFTGEGGATYTLTDTSNVEITSGTAFTITLSATDKAALNLMTNKDGTASSGGTTYNLAAAEDWAAGADAAVVVADLTGNGVTASNVAVPTITSSTYNASTGALVVTGTGFLSKSGATNDIDVSKLTFTGEGGSTYTLTTSSVEITSGTSFSVTLNATDLAALNQIVNKNGTSSTGATTYNLAAAEDWAAGADAAVVVADLAGNGITASNVAVPTITSSTYNASTGALIVTGTGFLKLSGAANDIVANKFTFTAEGGATYTLTDTANVEITSGTAFTITLSATDLAAINQIVNKNGTSSTGATTYNLAAAEDWAAGADAAVVVADTTGNGITASNVAVPAITSATYNASTGALVVTGTGFLKLNGATNDIDVSKLTFTGEGGSTYTLTSSSVEITSGTSFSVTLNATDLAALNQIVNKNGTSSTSATTYNLAAAEDWAAGADAAVVVADTTGNGITASNVAVPAITSATYDSGTGVLTVSGTHFVHKSGSANDIDLSMFTFTGEAGGTYTLTTATDVEITSGTSFTVTLSGADKTGVDALLNKIGTSSTDATTYNLAGAEDWMAGTDAAVNVVDGTNAITVSQTVASSGGSSGGTTSTTTNIIGDDTLDGIVRTPITTTTVGDTTVTTQTGTGTRTFTDANGESVTQTNKVVEAIQITAPTGSTTTTSVPLYWGESSKTAAATTASVSAGVTLASEGNRAPTTTQTKATAIDDLIYYIQTTVPSTDGTKSNMLGGGSSFLTHLNNVDTLVVNKVVLSSTASASSTAPATVSLDGTATAVTTNGVTQTPTEALVIDGTSLPSGSTVSLTNIEFGVLTGTGLNLVLTGTATQTVYTGSGTQTLNTGSSTHNHLYAGAGNDHFHITSSVNSPTAAPKAQALSVSSADTFANTVANKTALYGEDGNDTTTVEGTGTQNVFVHGGSGNDSIVYGGSMSDYTITRDNGITYVHSNTTSKTDILLNVESIQFADGTYAIANNNDLTQIASLYQQVLGRQADVDGFQYWASTFDNGDTIGAIATSFVRSSEYFNNTSNVWDSMSSDQKIETFYQLMLGRASDAAGKAYWMDAIHNGMSIEDIAGSFVVSAEMQGIYTGQQAWNFFV